MANLEGTKEAKDQQSPPEEDEFEKLEGSKCRAPFGSSYGGTTYHNAMICSCSKVDDDSIYDSVIAKVLFLNPTHKEMLPCPYFLEGNCKFSEEQCHYSHGHTVPFENLKEYKKPDYLNIRVGSLILAKGKNKLWHRAVVQTLPDASDNLYGVKFESSGIVTELNIQDLLPLSGEDLNLSDSSDDGESDEEEEGEESNDRMQDIVQRSLLMNNSSQALGTWEKHTRGIGSKLMEKMGYIMGTGLGREAEGRIDPVEATVFPAGKSLDHCMALREFAGGDKDFFSAEKKMKAQQKKLEEQRNRDYLRQKQAEKHNVFNFINTNLGDKQKDKDCQPSTSNIKRSLKSESTHKLNVESFKIGENITRLEAEKSELKLAISRHTQGSIHHNNLVMRLNERQKEIDGLRVSEQQIASEQKKRKLKSKLAIF